MNKNFGYINDMEEIPIKDNTKGILSLASDIFEVNRNGYVGIVYNTNHEKLKVPQYAYRFPKYPHQFVTKFILEWSKCEHAEYAIFEMIEDRTETCAVYENCEGDLIPTPVHTVRFLIKDVTEERTKSAMMYKSIIDQLD